MLTILDTILTGVGVVASLATIISALVPIINQYIYKDQLDPKIKARQQKITGIIIGFGLVSTTISFGILSTLPRPSTPLPKTRGTLLYHFFSNNLQDITTMEWSPDGTRIATADEDGTIQVWDALTGNHNLTYQPPSWHVNSLSWSPDGKYIAINTEEHLDENHLYILRVDSATLQHVFTLNSPQLGLGKNVIAWSPDGVHIATACSDNNVRVWNVSLGQIDTNQKPLIYTHHSKNIYALTWSPDGQYIASASGDNTIQIWQVSKGDTTYRSIPDDALNSAGSYANIAWSPNGNLLATEDGKGVVSIWFYDTGYKALSINTYSSHFVYAEGEGVAWSPDSQYLAIGRIDNSLNGKVQVVSWGDGSIETSFTDNGISGPIRTLSWSPDGNYLAAATGFGNGVLVWQARGIDNRYVPQILLEDQEPWPLSLIKTESIALGIIMGTVIFLLSLIRDKRRQRLNLPTTRRKIILSFFSKIILYFFSFLLILALLEPELLIFGPLTSTMLGLAFGVTVSIWFILALVLAIYILPFLKEGRVSKQVWLYIKNGDTYTKQGKYQRAIEDYNRALALNPTNIATYIARGDAYAEQEEYQWAIEDYDRALNNDGQIYYTNLFYSLLDVFFPDLVKLKLSNNNDRIYYKRGIAYFKLKEYQRAIEDYNHACELIPSQANIYYDRGIAYLWQKNIPQATVDFIHSNDLNPTDIDSAWKGTWSGMNRYCIDKEIAERLEQIAAANPQHHIAYVCRGVALGLRNNVKAGLRELETAISLAPKNWDAHFWKAMLFTYYYGGQSRAEDAKVMLEQSIAMGLPPILLTPLYWLEKDRPSEFRKYANPLLQLYDVRG